MTGFFNHSERHGLACQGILARSEIQSIQNQKKRRRETEQKKRTFSNNLALVEEGGTKRRAWLQRRDSM